MNPDRLSALVASGVTFVAPEFAYVDDAVLLEPGCIVHPQVFLRGRSVIRRNSTIQQGCEIADSEIGDGTIVRGFSTISSSVIGLECSIGPHAEVVESELAGRSRVGHYSLVHRCKIGEGVKIVSHCFLSHSDIGPQAYLSTGVVTTNYDGFAKHKVVVMSGAFIGTGTHLIAPVRIGDGAYVAAGSIITADVPPGALGIARGRQTIVEGWVARRLPQRAVSDEQSPSRRPGYYRTKLQEFTSLVNRGGGEEEYQKFLSAHYWLLGPYYEECTPKPRAGPGYIPDFVLERRDGQFEIVEIKTPTAPLFVRSAGRLVESSELKRAIAQLFDYLDYYKTHYLSESKIQGKDLRVAVGTLVIGRTITPEERERLQRLNERYAGINIASYDDLVAGAEALVRLIEKDDTL